MTLDEVQKEFEDKHGLDCWRGYSGTYYARPKYSGGERVAEGESPQDLRDRLRELYPPGDAPGGR